jgi:hypothetical protein
MTYLPREALEGETRTFPGERPLSADVVEKVEDRTTSKISQNNRSRL